MKCHGCGRNEGRPRLCQGCVVRRKELAARSVMTMYACGMTYAEIGAGIGKSTERVRQLIAWSARWQYRLVDRVDGMYLMPERIHGAAVQRHRLY